MRIWGAALGLGLAASCIAPARAQIPSINPGVIQNDVDRQRRQLEQQSAPPKLNGPAVIGGEREKSQLLKPGGPKFRLHKVEFDASKFITPAELDEIAKKYVGKNVDIASLLQLVADINALYTERGIVTGIATLPEQDAKGGIVRIKLTEGRLQKTTIEGNKQTRPDYILQRVKEPEGEVLDVPKLNRDVIWFNRTNDVQIKALLQPGTSFGLTDLQFAVIEPPVDTLQLFTDNQGAENTGRWEGGAFYKRHGLFGVDDRLTFYGVRSDGNLNGNVAYSIPVNPWGGRAGVSYTEGKIKIIQGPFVALDVTGRSSQAAVNFSQPVWVTQNWLVLLNAAETEGKTVSRFATVAVTQDHYDKATAGLSVTNSGNTYSITVSPAVNYIAWQDHVLGNNRAFNTYTGSMFATSAAGACKFQHQRAGELAVHTGKAAAGRPDLLDRWSHHRARLSLQLGVRRQRLLFQRRAALQLVAMAPGFRHLHLHRLGGGVLDVSGNHRTGLGRRRLLLDLRLVHDVRGELRDAAEDGRLDPAPLRGLWPRHFPAVVDVPEAGKPRAGCGRGRQEQVVGRMGYALNAAV
ncbi:hypothetical protein ACVWWO_008448 [Bradyrhizobium sp. F1.13.1]